METLTFKWNESNELLDPFFLTKIWNQFPEFKQFDNQNILLRKKEILKNRALHKGQSYQAALECKSKREVRSMIYYRYQLTVMDKQGIAIEILSDFVVVTNNVEKFNPTKAREVKSHPDLSEFPKEKLSKDKELTFTVDWTNVLKYLAKVEDDNPVHPQSGVIPGDYIAMQIIQHWSDVNRRKEIKANEVIQNYQSIELKFIHPTYREDQIYCESNIAEDVLTVSVFNQYGEKCMIFTCV
ncbi:hypothetical protein EIG99_08895 [Staphylococcus condimenti]|uniref:Uncharacterized protein n=1 Tax=Staphylococcus condimenti TaxID=70255 RepID=A0A4Q7CP30_9STAP|nr:hypothetical protein [Staphylococcus condimenti]RZI01412.1 hypothetical protein EIG99_08895 [Staphylococcus condimenti]RZI03769.1 hypothetical protein EIG98_06070 [Staphylococcus condimenti]